MDPMLLLSMSSGTSSIGRLRVTSPMANDVRNDVGQGESLSEILAWDGAENLFAELVNRYIFRAGISGVQPKVLVPELREMSGAKATFVTQDLIVKSGRTDYPGLAANEFLCMSIAKDAGMKVPEFFLSKNHELFVMRRFDRTHENEVIGFEDMAVLLGRQAQQKYKGSYALVAKAIRAFASPDYIRDSLRELFDIVALSCIVGNGDEHLKNFGLMYVDPTINDCKLAPAFDIVNTTAYISDDVLALELAGQKSFFSAREGLLGFANICGVEDPIVDNK